MSSGDDPAYVRKLMAWVRHHRRCRMLVYYQDFGSTSSYRLQNYPASLAALNKAIHHPPLLPTPRRRPRPHRAVSPRRPPADLELHQIPYPADREFDAVRFLRGGRFAFGASTRRATAALYSYGASAVMLE